MAEHTPDTAASVDPQDSVGHGQRHRRSAVAFTPGPSVNRRPILTALAAVSILLAATSAGAQVQIDWHAEVCGAQYASAINTLSNVPLPNRDPFDLDRAMTLFRFNRQRESRALLDVAARKARSSWRWRLPHDLRSEVTQDIDTFRDCVATTKPAPLGTLTVRTRGTDVSAMTVWIDAIAIGRTGRNGTITARVPSGVIRVTAQRTPSWWGSEYVSIRPGRAATLSITIDDGKEASEDTPLVLAEAVDDIVPASTTSFTLKFMRAGRLVPVVNIEQIDLDDPDATAIPGLAGLFTVSQGAILAKNPRALFDALGAERDRTIHLLVEATDSDEVFHANRVAFRVGRSGLGVALAPPPSNPQLAVSNIQVGVSVMGAGIAVERVSDARGRIEIDSFPHGPIAIECMAVSEGRYYYGEAMLMHAGQRQVTLVLRHVSDVINGVPAFSNQGPGGSDIAGPSERGAAGDTTEAVLDVPSRGRDEAISRVSTLIAPTATRYALLDYEVSTHERRSTSGFDDLWAISVLGARGERLFHVVRNVSSQFRYHPQWQPDNTTGDRGGRLDIGHMTAAAPARLTLVGTAINIGDNEYPTTVRAHLAATSR